MCFVDADALNEETKQRVTGSIKTKQSARAHGHFFVENNQRNTQRTARQ
jgi:hypothetical protein